MILLKNEQAQPSFEERLKALDDIVTRMEAGEMTLQESLTAYEAGMKLTAALNEELSRAEKRMQELSAGRILPMEDAP